jgi:tetratricopeptide (TPR) repeat protein
MRYRWLSLVFVTLLMGTLAAAQGDPLPDEKGTVAAAQAKVDADPKNVELILALGNAQAGVWRMADAIATYTKGLDIDPDNVGLLLNRGHRYVSTRQYDTALKDLAAAMDQIHPDPLKSELNDAFEIQYHIGVAYYLKGEYAKAIPAWDKCRELAQTDDQRASSSDWSYMTYRRAKRDAEAAAILEKVSPTWKITGSPYYFERLLFYKGLKKESEMLGEKPADVAVATVYYRLGNWYLMNGDRTKAKSYFEKSVASKAWAAWGYIGSQADLAKLR